MDADNSERNLVGYNHSLYSDGDVFRLKHVRRQLNMTQRDVAKALNCRQATISAWETGKNEPDFATLVRIADFFGVTTDYLLGRTDEEGNMVPSIKKKTAESTPSLPESEDLSAGLAMRLLRDMKYEDITENQKRAVYDFAMEVLKKYGNKEDDE